MNAQGWEFEVWVAIVFFFFLLKNRTKEFEKDKTNGVNFFEGWEEITMNYEYEEYDS